MLSLTSAAVVAAVALLAPLAVRLTGLRVPEIVVQILLGILIGPQVLGWAHADAPVEVLAVIGLAFLLLLAGLEIDFDRLRGRVLGLTSAAFAVSFALAVVIGFVLGAAGLVRSPLLIAVILSATGLGIILPILKDSGQTETAFGQVVVAGASIAEVVPIVLLSVLFSGDASGVVSQVALLVAFLGLVAAVGLLILGFERSSRISSALVALQDTTAEIRIRGALALLMVFAALSTAFGLEAILGAFLAGATLKLLDRDRAMTHSTFHGKLQAVGFGAFVPFFFVSTGMSLDVRSLVDDPATLVRVPIFLGALLLVRALPAALYTPLAQRRRQVLGAGLLQATSLSIPVVAGAIGVQLGVIAPGNYVALVAAGLLSVVLFPLLAVPLLGGTDEGPQPTDAEDPPRPVEDR
ncbi:cation:proton antiporter [Actinomycetospora sp.]|jgi:Kef-type K+ transport system membrane component KefB|uniref:cation:proton antiporter n=1 Tax=Actinomycetospora sp. TaxID=1872135 RepID=UPI002F3F3527